MSVQPSITSYFGKRKRLVGDGGFKSKLLKVEHPSLIPSHSVKALNDDEIRKVKCSPKATLGSSTPNKALLSLNEKCEHEVNNPEDPKKCSEPPPPSPVKFQLMGCLSPIKKSSQKAKFNKDEYNVGVLECSSTNTSTTPKNCSALRNVNESKSEYATEDIIKSAKELASKIKETRERLTDGGNRKKEISLKEIKDKINRSSKLTELKKSINKINQHAEELIELEKGKLAGTQPKLSKFKTFEISVPVSPVKRQKSPSKPAYERYAGLVGSPIIPLPLPFGYQKLYEFFCAADTICSMITNRGEVLTFNKLKSAVEEMTRKTFTTRHLGQIATVYPEAYSYRQEKLRNFGSTSKSDKYELVIIPKIPRNPELNEEFHKGGRNDADENVFRSIEKRAMTPATMKKRKDVFYTNLLKKTKDYHEEFLKTLNPPITISRDALKRWHPNFMVDFVPDVYPQELPEPPNTEKAASAKQILDRAKQFLSSNVRLQKALEAAAREDETNPDCAPAVTEVSPEVKAKVDARLKDPLKGIPKTLLEKVRARQAAKALDAMQMTPEQEKETIIYMRLPDMARIVRTAFVNEQKGVLPLEILIEKVQFSWSRNLGLKEVETHVRLLVQTLPDWLSMVTLRNVEFVKINRNVDATSVMAKLNKTVEEKKKKVGKW